MVMDQITYLRCHQGRYQYVVKEGPPQPAPVIDWTIHKDVAPSKLFELSKDIRTGIILQQQENKKGTYNWGEYKKVAVFSKKNAISELGTLAIKERNTPRETYSNPAGASKGDAGASATMHKKTRLESTYIR